jgi:hypothetical protein
MEDPMHATPDSCAPRRCLSVVLACAALAAGGAQAQTFSNPTVPVPGVAGDGLLGRFWSVGGQFLTSVAANEAAVAGVTPGATFRALVPTFPPGGNAVGNGLTLADYTGVNATDLAGNPALTIGRSYGVLDGFLRIDAPGTTVNFALTSDDGSILSIDGTVVVNNDGNHAPQTVTGSATFAAAGLYPLRLQFFENDGITVFALRAGFAGAPVADIPTALLYTAPIPEPSPWLMLGLGLVGLQIQRRRPHC